MLISPVIVECEIKSVLTISPFDHLPFRRGQTIIDGVTDKIIESIVRQIVKFSFVIYTAGIERHTGDRSNCAAPAEFNFSNITVSIKGDCSSHVTRVAVPSQVTTIICKSTLEDRSTCDGIVAVAAPPSTVLTCHIFHGRSSQAELFTLCQITCNGDCSGTIHRSSTLSRPVVSIRICPILNVILSGGRSC